MQQSNGAKLFHTDDPRSTVIGIIEVDPADDRQSILTALLTQEKVGRKQIALSIPNANSAFRRATDFARLEHILANIQAQVVFIIAQDSPIAKFARQHQLSTFATFEQYAQYVQKFLGQPVPADVAVPAEQDVTQPLATGVPTEVSPVPSTPPAQTTPPPPVLPATPAVVAEPAQPVVPATTAMESKKTDAVAGARKGEPSSASPLPHAEPARTRSKPVPAGSPPPSPVPLLLPAPSMRPVFVPASPALRRSPVNPARKRFNWAALLLLLLIVLLLGVTVLSVFLGLGPLAPFFPGDSATITITPSSVNLKQVYDIQAIPNLETPDLQHRQVAAHFLAAPALSQSMQVNASGQGSRPATTASGILTFYNASLQPRTIPAGTILVDANGIQITTNQTVTVAAAQSPLEGSQDVSAHAVVAGASGNIAALDFNVVHCCAIPDITARNAEAFTGGQDPQKFSYVQQSDIDQAANSLRQTLEPKGRQKLQGLILQTDQLVGTPQCVPTVSADHQARDEAPTVTVTVTMQCIGEVFNQSDARDMATTLLATDAVRVPGPNYTIHGQIATAIVSSKLVDKKAGTIALQVQAQGEWTYQFHGDWQGAFASLIKDKGIYEATMILEKQFGVRQASITVSGLMHNTLPADSQRIRFVVADPT